MLTGCHLQTRDCSSLGGEASLDHIYRNVHHIKAANPQWHHKMIAWTAKFIISLTSLNILIAQPISAPRVPCYLFHINFHLTWPQFVGDKMLDCEA